jgi:hypothetical protein
MKPRSPRKRIPMIEGRPTYDWSRRKPRKPSGLTPLEQLIEDSKQRERDAPPFDDEIPF